MQRVGRVGAHFIGLRMEPQTLRLHPGVETLTRPTRCQRRVAICSAFAAALVSTRRAFHPPAGGDRSTPKIHPEADDATKAHL